MRPRRVNRRTRVQGTASVMTVAYTAANSHDGSSRRTARRLVFWIDRQNRTPGTRETRRAETQISLGAKQIPLDAGGRHDDSVTGIAADQPVLKAGLEVDFSRPGQDAATATEFDPIITMTTVAAWVGFHHDALWVFIPAAHMTRGETELRRSMETTSRAAAPVRRPGDGHGRQGRRELATAFAGRLGEVTVADHADRADRTTAPVYRHLFTGATAGPAGGCIQAHLSRLVDARTVRTEVHPIRLPIGASDRDGTGRGLLHLAYATCIQAMGRRWRAYLAGGRRSLCLRSGGSGQSGQYEWRPRQRCDHGAFPARRLPRIYHAPGHSPLPYNDPPGAAP